MYSLIAFFLTSGQLAVIATSYFLHSKNVLYELLIYGSPFYLLMNMLGADSAFAQKSILYVTLIAYHIFKYVMIVQAQIVDGRTTLRMLAVVFEVLYLVLSAYWVNAGLV